MVRWGAGGALALAATVALSSCALSASSASRYPLASSAAAGGASSSTPPSASSDASASSEPTSALLLKAYESTTTDARGYKTLTSIKLSSVILGNDPDTLATAWAQVGGSGDTPCTAGTPDHEISSFSIDPTTSGCAFGTVFFTNQTTGFTAQTPYFTISGLTAVGAVGIGFSDGATCHSLIQAHIAPKWQDDTWGPRPIVIAVWNYRTPKNPTGDPQRLVAPLHFGPVRIPLSAAS